MYALVCLALWTRKVLCGRFYAPYINFHSFISAINNMQLVAVSQSTPASPFCLQSSKINLKAAWLNSGAHASAPGACCLFNSKLFLTKLSVKLSYSFALSFNLSVFDSLPAWGEWLLMGSTDEARAIINFTPDIIFQREIYSRCLLTQVWTLAASRVPSGKGWWDIPSGVSLTGTTKPVHRTHIHIYARILHCKLLTAFQR